MKKFAGHVLFSLTLSSLLLIFSGRIGQVASGDSAVDAIPENANMITTTPDVRHIRSHDGEQTDWLRIEPSSAETAQEHLLEITLQFMKVEGTIFINFYEQAPHSAVLDQKTIHTPATIIFQSASISSHYLEIIADGADSQAEYAVVYALRSQLRTSHRIAPLPETAATTPRTRRFSFSASDLSSRSSLLLCLGTGICVGLIVPLSMLLTMTKKRLQHIVPEPMTGIAPEDYHLLGDLALMQGKERLARRCYSRAAVMEPGNTSVHCELGKFLFQEKQYADAIKEFQIVLNGEPIPQEIYHYLAFSYLALNQIKQAEYYYEKSQEYQAAELSEDFPLDDERKNRRSQRMFSTRS